MDVRSQVSNNSNFLNDAGMGKKPPSTSTMLHQMVNHCGCTCMAMIFPVEPTLVRNLFVVARLFALHSIARIPRLPVLLH